MLSKFSTKSLQRALSVNFKNSLPNPIIGHEPYLQSSCSLPPRVLDPFNFITSYFFQHQQQTLQILFTSYLYFIKHLTKISLKKTSSNSLNCSKCAYQTKLLPLYCFQTLVKVENTIEKYMLCIYLK